MIRKYEEEISEYEEVYGEDLMDLDPMDASGGNFDDAYNLGFEHGESYGKYTLLEELLREFDK